MAVHISSVHFFDPLLRSTSPVHFSGPLLRSSIITASHRDFKRISGAYIVSVVKNVGPFWKYVILFGKVMSLFWALKEFAEILAKKDDPPAN